MLTPAQRQQLLQRKVALCVSDGMSVEKIAVVTGLTLDKLKRCFARELEHGREIIRAEELLRLDEQSGAGKTAASKLILETTVASAAGNDPQPNEAKTKQENVIAGALKIISGGKK